MSWWDDFKRWAAGEDDPPPVSERIIYDSEEEARREYERAASEVLREIKNAPDDGYAQKLIMDVIRYARESPPPTIL